jgi:hypothetical protein
MRGLALSIAAAATLALTATATAATLDPLRLSFAGHGVRGKWKLNEIVACRAVKLTLVLLGTR